MNAVRALFRQAAHEFGLLRVLGECVVVPSALIGLVLIAAAGFEMLG